MKAWTPSTAFISRLCMKGRIMKSTRKNNLSVQYKLYGSTPKFQKVFFIRKGEGSLRNANPNTIYNNDMLGGVDPGHFCDFKV